MIKNILTQNNIKKIYFLLIIIIYIFLNKNILSSITEGQQYIKLQTPIHNAPKILEFFSFYCTHCYQFEKIYNFSDQIKQKLPKNIIFYKYHINHLGSLGNELTHAWAVAIALKIENKISPILFMAIQKKKSIHTIEDIRKIFIQSGVNENIYDETWNSLLVKSLILKQKQAAINFKLKGVPAIFVNGQYMIKNDKLDISSVNAYTHQFSELLKFLTEKNEI